MEQSWPQHNNWILTLTNLPSHLIIETMFMLKKCVVLAPSFTFTLNVNPNYQK